MAKSLRSERGPKTTRTDNVVNAALLRSLADDLDEIYDERGVLNERAGEIYGRARDGGISPPVLRQVVVERRMDAEARHAVYALKDQYRRSLGMYADTPLGEATVEREAASANGKQGKQASKPKPFAAQPVGGRRRGPGRPRKINGPASVDDALDRARHHLGDDDLPPAA